MKAELIDHMGSDLTVVNAARVSFNKQSDWEFSPNLHAGVPETGWYNKLADKDAKLIKYLAKHNHWTPFGHPQITIRETVPIFVARQRFKHMVGFVYNEVSRRYDDSEPEFYIPQQWRKRADNIKQGSSNEVVETPYVNARYKMAVSWCEKTYQYLLEEGVAPEQARMVLPQSMMTSYYTTGSLAAWARAFKLRSDSHSQKEIQILAAQWNEIIRPLFPVSWSALVDNEA